MKMNLSSDMRRNNGTILIIALWSLGVLTILSISLGSGIRQKIVLLSRLEDRGKLYLIASSGIKKAITILKQDSQRRNSRFAARSKVVRYNNALEFDSIDLNDGTCEISYQAPESGEPIKNYGVIDEERKININKVEATTLKTLIKIVLGWDDIRASELTNAIIDWREYGESEIVGFFSDDYYDNLEFPYEQKNGDFEILDELLLVEGMNRYILNSLSDHITVYGDGRININTTSRMILVLMGLREELADAVLAVRKGPDGIEATDDDFIFSDIQNLPSQVNARYKLEPKWEEQIDHFIQTRPIGSSSNYYLIQAKAKLNNKNAEHMVRCVYNTRRNKIEYWREGI